MLRMNKGLIFLFGILFLVILFDIMVMIKNGVSMVAVGGLIVTIGCVVFLAREVGKDAAKAREEEEAQNQLEETLEDYVEDEEEYEEDEDEYVEEDEEYEEDRKNMRSPRRSTKSMLKNTKMKLKRQPRKYPKKRRSLRLKNKAKEKMPRRRWKPPGFFSAKNHMRLCDSAAFAAELFIFF